MKIYLICAFSVCFWISPKQINQKNEFPFDNLSVRYSLSRIGMTLTPNNNSIPSKYIIKVVKNKNQKSLIKSIAKKTWVKLLADSRTDWAANLVLYDIYKKDALLYNTIIKTRNDWIKVNKAEDIAFWQSFLK